MTAAVIFATLGVVLLIAGFSGLYRGAYWGNLYKVSRDQMPRRFYTSMVALIFLGLFCVAVAAIILVKADPG